MMPTSATQSIRSFCYGQASEALRSWVGATLIRSTTPRVTLLDFAQPAHSHAEGGKRDHSSGEVTDVDWSDLQAAMHGDENAYASLVRRYQGDITAYLWRFTRDSQECEVLAQDVFVDAYRGLGGFKGSAPFIHWLKRIATRVGYRYWKNRKRHDISHLTSGTQVIDRSIERDEVARDAAELVHVLLGQLRPRDRLVLTLVYLEECTIREAAELTGWSLSMVKVQLHRARRRFARICEEQEIDL